MFYNLLKRLLQSAERSMLCSTVEYPSETIRLNWFSNDLFKNKFYLFDTFWIIYCKRVELKYISMRLIIGTWQTSRLLFKSFAANMWLFFSPVLFNCLVYGDFFFVLSLGLRPSFLPCQVVCRTFRTYRLLSIQNGSFRNLFTSMLTRNFTKKITFFWTLLSHYTIY